jgi:hypothetical protein
VRFNEDVTVHSEWNGEDESELIRSAHDTDDDDSPMKSSASSILRRKFDTDPSESEFQSSSSSSSPTSFKRQYEDEYNDEENDERNDEPTGLDVPSSHSGTRDESDPDLRRSLRSGKVLSANITQIQSALLSGEFFMKDDQPDSNDMIGTDDDTLHSDELMWKAAVDSEVKSIVDKDVWDVMEMKDMPQNKTLVNYKWVFKKKYDETDSVIKYKTRLCAKGFTQREGIDYKETFSPVARHTTFKLIMSLGVAESFKYRQLDVKTAFLNATLNETIFMKMPPYVIAYMQEHHHQFMDVNVQTASKSHVLRLKKAIYGLKQAPREWYHTIDTVIRAMGFTRSKSDVCVYYQSDREHKIIILLYVDDIIIASKHDMLLDTTVRQLCQSFQMESDTLHYYIGMEVRVNVGVSTHLSQENYIKRICKRAAVSINMSVKTPMATGPKLTKNMSLGEGEKENDDYITTYRSNVSSIMYAAIQSRPDVTYPTNLSARFMTNP